MNKEDKREYMRDFMRQKRKKERLLREANTKRIREYRDSHREEIREYTKLQVRRWRAKQRLIAIQAAKKFIESSDKPLAEKLTAFEHLNKQAEELMCEVGIET